MKRLADLAVKAILFCLWLGGLLAGLLGHDQAARIVGMLLWIGIGAGHRLSEIEGTLKAIRADRSTPP